IGEGGMGVVYKARQRGLNRIVAVKMILRGEFSTPQERDRFRVEAEAAARLRHPNIVVVHELGTRDDQDFFSMEYIEGRSLADLLRQGPLPPMLAANYVRQAAAAIAYAHLHGVLHRDVKPSNVLIDAEGTARVTDFGLAKRIDQTDALTLTGQLVGTPAYMAPEQISRAAGEVGPASDVYALGALLYESLTGRPPFCGATQVETLLAALDGDPVLPRQIVPTIPGDLELIALKCLEKNPRDRYASANAVAQDLERFIQGESLSVTTPNRLERLVRALERSRFDREVYEAARFVAFSAWIALTTHAAIFLHAQIGSAHPLAIVVAIRAAEIGAMLAVFWPRRKDWFPPRGAAARQLWSMWLGYLTASSTLLIVDYAQAPAGQPYYSLHAYPAMAVLSSLAFWVLGSTYWGYCYVMGGFFLAAAVAMPLWLPGGPLVFGIAWGACLWLLGQRLRRVTIAVDESMIGVPAEPVRENAK
ncbi:MAG: serine/threonine protein kinase, partial [Planctomycetales bacterium]|nr:serine/threonine protein kinase [Planctomycetales bacterium]